MGVFASVTLYRTDSNQIMSLEEMTSSHLLNAIHHHNKQVDTCQRIITEFELNKNGRDRMERRQNDLMNTVMVLQSELVKRDVADEAVDMPSDCCGGY